jgi:hypothetical protein
VSKKFNIPSRTLYDKVKKMGITTGRQQQRKSMGGSFNGKINAMENQRTIQSMPSNVMFQKLSVNSLLIMKSRAPFIL